MNKKLVFCCVCLICALLSACVSKEKYSELEADLSETRAKLEKMTQQINALELKLKQSSEGSSQFEARISELQATNTKLLNIENQCKTRVSELQATIVKLGDDQERYKSELSVLRQHDEELEKENKDLYETLNRLGLELPETNLTEQEKEALIKEFNSSRQQHEIELVEQIKAREARIKAQQEKIQELDSKKTDSEGRLSDLSQQTGSLKKQIEEKELAIAELDKTKRQVEATLQARLKQRERTIEEQARVIANLDKTRREIEANLKEQIKATQVKLEEMEGKLKVTFIDKVLFDSGSASINPNGRETLFKLAENLKANQGSLIMVEGHTDNVKIGPAAKHIYPTNWELSAGRAATVVRFLQQEAGLDPERCAVSGFSYYRPVASNTTEDGRSQNRRIEIILEPRL